MWQGPLLNTISFCIGKNKKNIVKSRSNSLTISIPRYRARKRHPSASPSPSSCAHVLGRRSGSVTATVRQDKCRNRPATWSDLCGRQYRSNAGARRSAMAQHMGKLGGLPERGARGAPQPSWIGAGGGLRGQWWRMWVLRQAPTHRLLCMRTWWGGEKKKWKDKVWQVGPNMKSSVLENMLVYPSI
jgi:hypothetical protein